MEAVYRMAGQIMVFILDTSPVALVGGLIVGWLLGWLLAEGAKMLNDRRREDAEVTNQKKTMILGGITLVLALVWSVLAGFGAWLSFLPLLGALFLLGLVFHLGLRWLSPLVIVLVLFGLGFLTWTSISTLVPYEVDKPLIEARVRGREVIDEEKRISFILSEPEGDELGTYFINGEGWGIRVHRFELATAIPGLEGDAFMRADALVGYDERGDLIDALELNPLSGAFLQPFVERGAELEALKAVSTFETFNEAGVGKVYTVSFLDDQTLVAQLPMAEILSDDEAAAPSEEETAAEGTDPAEQTNAN